MKEYKITLKVLGQELIFIKQNVSLYSFLEEIALDLGKNIHDTINFITEIKVSEVL